ncbi:MAG TPA: hypothetical protein VLC09_16495, partial [Polyangiaceae bacterium]|nr:hypothetical protein [Polyangiaceae bacterium]
MSDDLLLRATRALREQRDGTIDDARAAEDRLIARLPRTRRIRPTSPWGLSMAALLIGSTVWATAGAPLPSWLDGSSSDVPPAAPPTPPSAAEQASPGKERDSSRPGDPAPTEPLPPAASPTLPAKSPEPRPLARADGHEPSNPNEPTALRPNEPSNPNEPTEPPAPEASESSSQKAALDLYQKAHELHFVARDYARALAAWDRYLQLA